MSLVEPFFKVLSLYFAPGIRIQIRIKVKDRIWIQIRIKVKGRIRIRIKGTSRIRIHMKVSADPQHCTGVCPYCSHDTGVVRESFNNLLLTHADYYLPYLTYNPVITEFYALDNNTAQ
jgi:hypothetical protein